jgi:hypothetical protein
VCLLQDLITDGLLGLSGYAFWWYRYLIMAIIIDKRAILFCETIKKKEPFNYADILAES